MEKFDNKFHYVLIRKNRGYEENEFAEECFGDLYHEFYDVLFL